MNLFLELHSDLPREGPGCNASTRRAFESIPNVPIGAKLLDVGCGPGIQTMLLASLLEQGEGFVLATDVNQEYLNELQHKVEAAKFKNVSLEIADMFNLHYQPGSFDIIWAEGAIFIMGFENGLREWRKFLKPNGHIVVSELSWLKTPPPEEAKNFWGIAYPAMKTVEENASTAEVLGFEVVSAFTLPESSWYEDYYDPMERRAQELQEKYATNAQAISELESYTAEISMYKQYSDYYGYQFYVLRSTVNEG